MNRSAFLIFNCSFLIGEKRCMKLIKNFRPLVEGRESGIDAFALKRKSCLNEVSSFSLAKAAMEPPRNGSRQPFFLVRFSFVCTKEKVQKRKKISDGMNEELKMNNEKLKMKIEKLAAAPPVFNC